MHAFLLTGLVNFEAAIDNLAKKNNAKKLEFSVAKIDDVRNLNNLIRLSFSEPTMIVCQNIHEATDEALNAFLKNLEEPQENIFFALTAPTDRKVLPTIVSRCQIMRVLSTKYTVVSTDVQKFLNMTLGDKLAYIGKIKDRKQALEFAENTVYFLHSQLTDGNVKYSIAGQNLEASEKTYSRLKSNGNVNLQLSNFAIKYKNGQ